MFIVSLAGQSLVLHEANHVQQSTPRNGKEPNFIPFTFPNYLRYGQQTFNPNFTYLRLLSFRHGSWWHGKHHRVPAHRVKIRKWLTNRNCSLREQSHSKALTVTLQTSIICKAATKMSKEISTLDFSTSIFRVFPISQAAKAPTNSFSSLPAARGWNAGSRSW